MQPRRAYTPVYNILASLWQTFDQLLRRLWQFCSIGGGVYNPQLEGWLRNDRRCTAFGRDVNGYFAEVPEVADRVTLNKELQDVGLFVDIREPVHRVFYH